LRTGVFAAAVSAALFICGQSQAAAVLDQHSAPETGVVASLNSVGGGISQFAAGQGFTVGLTGTLSEIDVGVLHLALYPTTGFEFTLLDGGGAVLFAQHFAASDVPEMDLAATLWNQLPSVDLSGQHLQVTAGDHLSFTVFSDPATETGDFMLYAVDNTPLSYAGGSSFLVIGGGSLPTTATYAFRTYVDSAGSVPEPAAWALMLVGFGATGAMLRRSRAVAA
jgi:hypothetical protein